jgi:hypothetical protein
MAERSSPIRFDDVSLDEAGRMSRGPRMSPELYTALTQNIQTPDATPTRMPHPEVTNPTTMKHRILRVATALGIPVTVRKVPGGLLFRRSTGEDLQQAPDVANRLQGRRQQQRARPHGRPRRVTR